MFLKYFKKIKKRMYEAKMLKFCKKSDFKHEFLTCNHIKAFNILKAYKQ